MEKQECEIARKWTILNGSNEDERDQQVNNEREKRKKRIRKLRFFLHFRFVLFYVHPSHL